MNDELEDRIRNRTAELLRVNEELSREIAERERAEQTIESERQRLYNVLETLPAYLLLLTPDYHVPFTNRFFRERFGESHDRRCYEYLFNRDEPCENCESYTVLQTMAPHEWEWTGPDGRFYHIYDFPFTEDDGSTLILEVGIDITESKRAMGELEKYRAHLEDLVMERTRELAAVNARLQTEIIERKQAEEALMKKRDELAAANEELQAHQEQLIALNEEMQAQTEELNSTYQELREADRHKNEFMAVLSHELRNPLASIHNSLHILDRAVPGGEQAKRAMAVIDRQVEQLAHLVDDLLDVTRINQNKIKLQRKRIELCDLVRRALDDHRALFEKHGVLLSSELPPSPLFVNADTARLAQVIGNLLQNAVKFTPREGCVTVSVARDPGGRAVVRVADTGVGISPEVLPRLFQPFMQADTTLDRSRGGLGLGLALSRGLVELHGGEISARSEGIGKGAEFTVSLPLDQPPPEEPGEPQKEITRCIRRVLIIEDNVDLAESLRELLELDGHEVAIAYSGPEGLALAREFQPEILLCDIGLPGMDGYEVARAFHADEALKGVYLVALTGYAQPEDLQRAAGAGFDRHLAKPPDLGELERMLAEV
ncbi:MAG: ATP-binding protein [Patescibacteria group bacterium]